MEEDTTEDQIVASMLERYDATEEQVRRDVIRVITELRGIGALDE